MNNNNQRQQAQVNQEQMRNQQMNNNNQRRQAESNQPQVRNQQMNVQHQQMQPRGGGENGGDRRKAVKNRDR